MSSGSPPLPPTGQFVNSVRTSARAAREAAGIKIPTEAIHRLLRSPAFLLTHNRLASNHGFAFPFKFPSHLAELNFISVLSILNFLSGYRVPLHTLTGRGAYDTIRAFMFGLHLTSSNETDWLSARGMAQIDVQTVAELMNIKVHEEKPHPKLPGVTIGELGGAGYEIVQLVTGVMNETGSILVQSGYPSLGAFVLEALQEGEKVRATGGPEVELNVVVERLVRAFPAFRDMAIVKGQPVYCFKKAMILVHGIVMRFGALSPPPFPIPDTASLPVFSDNVIPSMLIHLGVLDLTGTAIESHFPVAGDAFLASLLAAAPEPNVQPAPEASREKTAPAEKKKAVPEEGPTLSVEEAFALRAAAIDACELIVEAAHNPELAALLPAPEAQSVAALTLPDLDGWLWAVAKDRPDYRKLKRFALVDTVFF